MKINSLRLNKWYILEDFDINFEKDLSVIIGENGSGKSSVIEFIALVFGHLHKYFVDGDKTADFIESYCVNFTSTIQRNGAHESHEIEIESLSYQDETDEEGTFKHVIKIDGTVHTLKQANALFSDVAGFKCLFPPSIVLYYAGITNRLEKLSTYFEDKYKGQVIKANNTYTINPLNLPTERPFFYCKPNHLSSILLCLMISESEFAKVITEKLEINENENFIIINLKKPSWAKKNELSKSFWGSSEGAVKDFLSIVSLNSYENLYDVNNISITYVSSLNVKDMLGCFDVENKEIFFFRMLDLLMFDDLLDNIDISWKNLKGEIITLDRLSEGEKQMILTSGLAEIWNVENSLLLLDEPDTFLHPKWQAEFIPNLSKNLKGNQAIITTHSPSIVSDVSKQQLIGMKEGKIVEFAFNPYGKKVEEVLLDFFNVKSLRNMEVDLNIKHLRDLVEENKYDTKDFLELFRSVEEQIGTDDPDLISILLEVEQRKL